MTIEQAIKWLNAARTKHGGETLVYFDCPKCGTPYTPGKLVAEAIHVVAEEKPKP
jgi:hypothetical protein